jgi:hypothetical protein
MLRGISIEYGHKFYLRTQGFYSILILVCFGIYIYFIALILKLIDPKIITLVYVIE